MSDLIRTVTWQHEPGNLSKLLDREWIVTNGLGGYASGTVAGVITRRFHGMLIAALPSPHGRYMMLNDLSETLRFPDGGVWRLGGEERVNSRLELRSAEWLKEFRLERSLPVWTYSINGITLEKRVVMPHRQNTVQISYRILEPDADVRLELRPSLQFRPHEGALGRPLNEPHVTYVVSDRFEFASPVQHIPRLKMKLYARGSAFTFEQQFIQEVLYRIEEARGYESRGDLWSPGYFACDLRGTEWATVTGSIEPWETIEALDPRTAHGIETQRFEHLLTIAEESAREEMGAELVLAADQFIITPVGRVEEMARARARGDEVRTVIAGYHWFTDWGRDTMISLEGLTLVTGRHTEAGWILRTFAQYIRDGLIPNMFPEGEREGVYHTADATLWFFHAIDRYLDATGDRVTLRRLLPKLLDIADRHMSGTRFGIGVDPNDGLLRQGAEGYQLTWMDAKVDGWVVTPRRGKAVEINALWYNALKLLEHWLHEEGEARHAERIGGFAQRVFNSFNQRFWYEKGGYLYDVVDKEGGGDDVSMRPNQLLAISLRHPALEREHWKAVVEICREKLLTPVGLRSLAPGSPDYKSAYSGNLRDRDAAYHQGTVWAWLIGPFIDAWLRVYPDDRPGARRFLDGFKSHLDEAGVGSISEVFDAESPFTPRGCIAQAWSVAEVLRCWVRTAV